MSDDWKEVEDIETALRALDNVLILDNNEGLELDRVPSQSDFDKCFFACPDCGIDDWYCDERGGDLVCRGCGCCDPGIYVSAPTHADQQRAFEAGTFLTQEDARDMAYHDGQNSVTTRRRNRASSSDYRRITYARERIRQWAMLEPTIDPTDWERIRHQYLSWAPDTLGKYPCIPTGQQLRNSRGQPIAGCIVLTKEEIRSLLHACDVVRSENLGEFAENGYYVRKYLERWISIRWRLSGYGGVAEDVRENVLELLLDDFPRVEEGFRQKAQQFLKRKSLLPYNDVYARLLKLYDLEQYATDFPPLKTRRARKKSLLCWWFICSYWGWPFLEKEPKILTSVAKLKD